MFSKNPEVKGYVAPGFEKVKIQFEKNLADGFDIGAGIAIYWKGELIIDLTGGYKNILKTQHYDENTIQMVYSSGKALAAILTARLVDQGLLDYNAKIVQYWPEFGQGNKQDVLLKDLLCHRAGVSWIDTPLTPEILADNEKFVQILAAQPHNFGGEPKRSYHAMTRGWYLNEIVRRVDPKGRTFESILRTEINPVYSTEFHYAFTSAEEASEYKPRIADMIGAPYLQLIGRYLTPAPILRLFGIDPLITVSTDFIKEIRNKDTPAFKSLVRNMPVKPKIATELNSDRLRLVESPSFSLLTNARSIARIASIMANKGRDPTDAGAPPLLSEKTWELANGQRITEMDQALRTPIESVVGGWAVLKDIPNLEGVEFMGWGGAGGSLFLWNEEKQLGIGYVMNLMDSQIVGNRASSKLLKCMLKCIETLEEGKGSKL